MLSSANKNTFLQLVKLGIGHRTDGPVYKQIDWGEIQALADMQGLSAIVLDGIDRLPEGKRPPQELLLQWIGETLQDYEYRYDAYRNTIAEMAGFYNCHGYKMMVLKGYACSLNWPRPEHRPCGDIDIWQFGEHKKTDALVASEKGFEIDRSHHHHTVFIWNGFSVENHYDFNNVHHHRSSVELEKIFKEFGKDDTHSTEVLGEKVYLPSPNLHALFLLKHSMTDFAAFYVTLRQILDWAFFVEKHTNEIDWKWLNEVMEQFHMKEFYNCINAICVEDLGFKANIFNGVQFNPALKDKILSDILEPKFSRTSPSRRLIPKLMYMFRRWRGNAWKHELCYKESLLSGFWSGIKNHLLKPKSI